ncbi:hypothetical protein BH09BAC3_BH09BAC3_10570 [soil metagenome]
MNSEETYRKQFYRVRFNRALEPVKTMLLYKKQSTTSGQWLNLVDKTRIGVLNRPTEYLNGKLPENEVVTFLIDNIFRNFIKTYSGRLSAGR